MNLLPQKIVYPSVYKMYRHRQDNLQYLSKLELIFSIT